MPLARDSHTAVLHVADTPFHGRAGAVHLLLCDAGIPAAVERHQLQAWAEMRVRAHADGRSVLGTLPMLELHPVDVDDDNGGGVIVYAGQGMAMLRAMARHLGAYSPDAAREQSLADAGDADWVVDSVSEMCGEWRGAWTRAYFPLPPAESPPPSPSPPPLAVLVQASKPLVEEYRKFILPRYMDAVESHLVRTMCGPYLLGREISYVDFAIYTIAADSGIDPSPIRHRHSDASNKTDFAWPRVTALMRAIEARDGVHEWMRSDGWRQAAFMDIPLPSGDDSDEGFY